MDVLEEKGCSKGCVSEVRPLCVGPDKDTTATMVRHALPQIPSMSHHPRMAVSKASVKLQQPGETSTLNIVPMEELESVLNRQEQKVIDNVTVKVPAEVVPKNMTPTKNSAMSDTDAESLPKPTSPIRLRIRRSLQGQLSSTVCDILETRDIASEVSQHQVKTVKQLRSETAEVLSTKNAPHTAKRRGRPSNARSSKAMPSSSTEMPTQNEVPSNIEVLDQDVSIMWQDGDVGWNKVSGHPWWPFMISPDPLLGQLTRLYGGPRRSSRQYHVQYFGNREERGWAVVSNMLPFKGLQHFKDYCEDKIAKRKKDRKRYDLPKRRRKEWEIAVMAAENAISMDRTERIEKLTISYVKPETNNKNLSDSLETDSVDKSSYVESESSEKIDKMIQLNGELPTRKKLPKRKLEGTSCQESSISPPKKKKKLCDDSLIKTFSTKILRYSGYYKSRNMLLKEAHPDYNFKQIKDCVREEWSVMTEEQKNQFCPSEAEIRAIHLSSGSKPRHNSTQKLAKQKEPRPLLGIVKKKLKDSSECDSYDMDTERLSSIDTDDSATEGKTLKVKRKKTAVSTKPMKAQVENKAYKGKEKSKVDLGEVEVLEKEEEYEIEILKMTSSCQRKKENICRICEQTGDLVTCDGSCLSTYHQACLGQLNVSSVPYKCEDCSTGNHTCFACKKTGPDTRKCSNCHCGKFYHLGCIAKYPGTRIENNHFYCPLHACASCAADNPRTLKPKGRLYKCIKCPTSYHVGDFCIAAGSKHLAGLNIICSKHFVPSKNQSHHSHLNVSWCFICSKGGTLLCCDSCPSAFHAECLDIDTPEGSWYCHDCASGKRPLYGDIVWVKLGAYRWWPCEICHPRNVPVNIQEKRHNVGQFPVRFFGSHDYFWINQNRMFSFQEGDKGSKENSWKGISKVFRKAVEEATEAFRTWQAQKEKREEKENARNEKKPDYYKYIKSNVGNVITKPDLSTIPRCECRPDQENPCGSDTECLNRMMMYECHPAVCPAGEKCGNRRFQRREYVEAVQFKTEGRGWGLYTKVDIKKHQFVNEYVGELIDEDECKRRLKQYHEDNVTNFYMLTLDKNRVIDAGPKGNLSRFMNHSCQPNCETVKWNVNGDIRVGLFARMDIVRGTELTFNYNLECRGDEKTVCQCGSPNCSGYLGVRPKSSAMLDGEKRVKDSRKKKRKHKPNVVKIHEDNCYRCGRGGTLVMCDKSNCPKVYHLKCLKLSKMPHGKWICPWHHCDVCGKPSTKLCLECPNSFCPKHIEDNIFQTLDNKLICEDHHDVIAAIGKSNLKTPTNEPDVMAPTETSSSESSSSPSDTESSATSQVDAPSHTSVSQQKSTGPTASLTGPSTPSAGESIGTENSLKRSLTSSLPVLVAVLQNTKNEIGSSVKAHLSSQEPGTPAAKKSKRSATPTGVKNRSVQSSGAADRFISRKSPGRASHNAIKSPKAKAGKSPKMKSNKANPGKAPTPKQTKHKKVKLSAPRKDRKDHNQNVETAKTKKGSSSADKKTAVKKNPISTSGPKKPRSLSKERKGAPKSAKRPSKKSNQGSHNNCGNSEETDDEFPQLVIDI